MFGSFTGLTGNSGTDWGEKLLNTVASTTIRHMFTQSDSVEVQVRCYPSSKLLQGSIDRFQMNGRGLVIRRQFRVEEMSFETDVVALDFAAVMAGQIRLKQSTQAIAQVALTEADINHSFKADLVTKRLQNLSHPTLLELSGGSPVSFSDVEVKLLADNDIQLFAKADLGDRGIVPISLTANLAVERRRRILFQNPQFQGATIPDELQEVSKSLAKVLAEILDNMVDLDRFNLDGVTMRINRLETQGNLLVFSGYAQIDRVPMTP